MWSSILVRCHTRLHREFLQKCGRVEVFRIKKSEKYFSYLPPVSTKRNEKSWSRNNKRFRQTVAPTKDGVLGV